MVFLNILGKILFGCRKAILNGGEELKHGFIMLSWNLDSVPCDCLRLWAVVNAKADASSFASFIVSLRPSQLAGYLDKVSGILSFTPGTCIIVNLYCNVFSLKLQSLGLGMSLRDWSMKILREVCDQHIIRSLQSRAK